MIQISSSSAILLNRGLTMFQETVKCLLLLFRLVTFDYIDDSFIFSDNDEDKDIQMRLSDDEDDFVNSLICQGNSMLVYSCVL